MFLSKEWQKHKGSGLLNDTQPDGHMVTKTVQRQCLDPTTTVGVLSSLESGSLVQGPPESQSVGLAYLHRVKLPWLAFEDRVLSAGSENPEKTYVILPYIFGHWWGTCC